MNGIRKLPAARGLAWFSGSIALLKAQPARLLLIGLALQFLMGFSQFGALGFLLLLALPALTAGVLQALSLVEHGYRPPFTTLFSAFPDAGRVLRLFILGAVSGIAAMLAAGALMSGALESMGPEALARLEQGDIQALAGVDPGQVRRLALGLVAGLFVSGAIAWFGIPLVWFTGRPVGRAIVEGIAGLVRNWQPLLVLGLLLGIVAVPVALAAVATMAAAYGAGRAVSLLTLVMLLLMVLYQMLLFGAQYCSFRDIFADAWPGADRPADGEDQLVA